MNFMIAQFFGYCRKNLLVIVLFAFVSLMFGLPHIINISKIGYGLYTPFPAQNGLVMNMDENIFAPAFQDAADGHFIVRSPQLKEYKDSVSYLDVFPFLAIGIAAALFSVGAREIFIAADFVFPPFVFLFFFLLAKRVFSLEKKLAALSALLIILFSFTDFIRGLISLSIFDILSAKDYPVYSKFYAPEFIAIPFLISLILLFEAFRKDNRIYTLAASLSGALLFYTYIYYSSFFWATFFIFSISNLYQGKSRISVIKKMLTILIPAVILSIPYALNFIAFTKSAAYHDILVRAGLETARFIHMPLIYAAVSMVFLTASYPVMFRKNRFLFSFVASMLLTVTLLMNMQIITGYNVQPWHWGLRILEFLYFLIAAYIVQEGLGIIKTRNLSGIMDIFDTIAGKLFSFLTNDTILRILIAVFLIYGFVGMTAAATSTTDIYAISKPESDLYKWLGKNTPPDSTVMTLSIKQSLQIPSFTQNNVYLPDGRVSGRTTEELVDRFVFAHALYNATHVLVEKLNVSNDAFRLEYLNKLYEGARFGIYDFEKYYFIFYFFHQQFFYGLHDYQQKNPDIAGARGFYFPLSFRDYVKEKLQSKSYKLYSFDYVLVGPYEKSFNAPLIENNYRKIYSNSEFSVYAK